MMCVVSVLFSSASMVLNPLPVIASTVGSSGAMVSFSINFFAAASVTPPGGFGEDPFCSGKEFDGFYDFNIGGVFADTPGVADCINRIDAVCRITNSERFSDRVRSDRLYEIATFFIGVDDGTAAFRLGNVDSGVRFVY